MAEDKSEISVKTFWEAKAKKYPLPFDAPNFRRTEEVISLVKKRGVDILGARVLDLGCGTGIYTLVLAAEASWVRGIDISPAMIDRLKAQALSHNILNVDAINISWDKAEESQITGGRPFDIVWASMTQAVRDEPTVKKMEECSRRWCVYIGWGSKRENPLQEEIFRLHNLEYKPPPGAALIYGILNALGRNPSLDYMETSWETETTMEESLEDISAQVAFMGGKLKKEETCRILKKHQIEGVIKQTTNIEKGIMVWRVS